MSLVILEYAIATKTYEITRLLAACNQNVTKNSYKKAIILLIIFKTDLTKSLK
ncbi:MAG: hypothetical protein F6K58_31160 [Symploca sp. SIO2E9]|nr:hypothetical protein [Symploca sp. SIO2E9]